MMKFGKGNKDLVRTNGTVTDYNGKSTAAKGVVMLNVCVGTVNRLTMFVVMPLKANYNALLRHDWIHGVEATLSTLHQKLILWNKEGRIEIVTNDSYCNVENFHVDFKKYNDKIKPLEIEGDFDLPVVESFIIG